PRADDPAPGRRARWLKIQEVRSSVSGGAPAMALELGAQAAHCVAEGDRPGKQAGLSRSGMQIAGAWAPKGSPWGGKPPRRAQAFQSGPSIGCRVGARAPVAPSPAPPAGPVVLKFVKGGWPALCARRPGLLLRRRGLGRNPRLRVRRP